MHERKALMASRSSGFLTLPGGVGTYEEFFEILTWAGLGLHRKPIGVLNVEGYFDPLLALLDHAVAERFVRPEHLELIVMSDQPETLVADLLGTDPSLARPEVDRTGRDVRRSAPQRGEPMALSCRSGWHYRDKKPRRATRVTARRMTRWLMLIP